MAKRSIIFINPPKETRKFIKVLDVLGVKDVVGKPFNLPTHYLKDDGKVERFIEQVPDEEKLLLGLYPVEEVLSANEYDTVPNYEVLADKVVITYTAVHLEDYKASKLTQIYQKAKQILDEQAEGYSFAEIATWPAIQADVVAYNLDNTVVGTALQTAADTSAYTVAELAAVLTPKVNVINSTIANRSLLFTSIRSALTHDAVELVDVNAGW